MASSLKNSFRFAPPAFVAVSDVRIKVCLVAGLAVAVYPCQSFNLASQQVNFLEITAGFLRFDDELGQPRFRAHFDTADGATLSQPSRCFQLCTVGRFICNMAAICGTENPCQYSSAA